MRLVKIAAAVTMTTTLLTLGFDIAERRSRDNPGTILSDTVSQCTKWYDIATQDTATLLKYKHMVQAQSYLNVSRHMAPDDVIEQVTGLHIRALQKRTDLAIQNLEKTLAKSVKTVTPKFEAKRASWL